MAQPLRDSETFNPAFASIGGALLTSSATPYWPIPISTEMQK